MKYIFLISGKLQSGKNQFTEYFAQELKDNKFKVSTDLFAAGVKNGCKEDFKRLSDYLNNYTEELKSVVFSFANSHSLQTGYLESVNNIINKLQINDDNWFENKTDITRIILQAYGTEIFRRRVDNDWWVKQTRKRVFDSPSNAIILTDCRFPNEVNGFIEDLPKDTNTITIRINRNINTDAQLSEHESEKALDDFECWNYIVDNNGTLNDLKDSAKTIINDILGENNEL